MQRTRRALLASLLITVSVALGFALAGVPNVELMTITVFISGYLLGVGWGALVGAGSITVHSVFNPLGAALPPLLLAQMIGFAVIGSAGGMAGPLIVRLPFRWQSLLVAALVGFALTLLYDVLTNIGAFYTITGENAPSNILKFVAAGVLFTVMHLVWNTAIFFVALTPALNVFARHRQELVQD